MNIVFVCTGNTCRSPMAEGYLKSLKLKGFSVTSAGLSSDGEPVSQNSALVMSEVGIDISSHTSKRLTKEMAENADKIFVMTQSHYHIVCGLLSSQGINTDKVSLLDSDDIIDPFMQDIYIYRKCRDKIFDAIDTLFDIKHYSISHLSESDAEDIEALEKECFSTPWSKASIIDSMNSNNIFLGIKEKDTLCAYISMYYLQDEGYINNLAVLPRYRRQKMGQRLMRRLIAFCTEADFSFISLEVRESNLPAISLYKNFGFKEEGRRKNYYDAPKEDAIILTRRF